MLNFIRSFRGNLVGRAVFGLLAFLLIASFAVWGISDVFLSPRQELVVAKVGSVKIMSGDFLRAYRDETEQIAELLGEDFDAERGRELGFIRSIMNTLVGRALFDNIAEKLDLAIPRETMRESIIATPQFQDEFGTFNELIFRRTLLDSGFSEETFLRNLESDLKRKQLIDTVISIPKIPPTLLNSLAMVRKEQRTATSILIAAEEIAEPPPPPESALEEWYRQNGDKYKRQQLRSFSYFNVAPKQLLGEIIIAEEAVRELYAQRKPSFEVAERRNVSQIRLDDEQAAIRVAERLRNGEDFLKVAKEVAGLDEQGVSLGWNTEQDLIAKLAAPTFKLELKEIGGPYETAFGWHVMRVEEITPGKTFTFAEKRTELTDELALEEAAESVYQLMIKVEDELAGGAPLEQAAAIVGGEVQRLDKVTSIATYENGDEVKQVANRLFKEAFALLPQTVSGVIDTGSDGFFVLRVEEIEAARPKTFAEAETEVLADWRLAEKKKTAAARAERVKTRLANGEGLTAIAESMELKTVAYKPFSRFSFEDQEIPPPFADALFNAAVGDVVAVSITEGEVVGVLTDIIPAKADDLGLAAIEKAIHDNLGADLVSQYQSWLVQRYRVTIDDKAIDEVL